MPDGYLATVAFAAAMCAGGLVLLVEVAGTGALRRLSWLILLMTAGAVGLLLLLIAGPVAFWIMTGLAP
ncbi:MAG TPA: hypothetical protein VJZ72_11040 [Candidatus Limnocylindrales bacterium]|nr:hypothetical protein [Candidatus Limnocylindrales bacterium]